MTRILNSYIFGVEEDEHIITDWHVLSERSFEDVIIERLRPYYGQSVRRLASLFGISTTAKNVNELLLSKMLGIEGRASKTVEFQNASIVPKTIRVQRNGRIKESMSFPAFKFTELIEEEWETSTLREMLEPTKFMFVIFKEDSTGEYFFERVKFWNIPAKDLEEVQRLWQRTVDVIRNGVELNFDEEALIEVAETSLKRKTGARGLRAIMENIMMDIMYHAPSDETLESCLITGDVVRGTGEPVCVRSTKRLENA
jgi:hypothetical protein